MWEKSIKDNIQYILTYYKHVIKHNNHIYNKCTSWKSNMSASAALIWNTDHASISSWAQPVFFSTYRSKLVHLTGTLLLCDCWLFIAILICLLIIFTVLQWTGCNDYLVSNCAIIACYQPPFKLIDIKIWVTAMHSWG